MKAATFWKESAQQKKLFGQGLGIKRNEYSFNHAFEWYWKNIWKLYIRYINFKVLLNENYPKPVNNVFLKFKNTNERQIFKRLKQHFLGRVNY